MNRLFCLFVLACYYLAVALLIVPVGVASGYRRARLRVWASTVLNYGKRN